MDPGHAWKPGSITQKLNNEFKQGGDTLSILNKIFQAKDKWLFVSVPYQAGLDELIQLDTVSFERIDLKTVSVHNVACKAILRKLEHTWSYTLYFYEADNASPVKLDLRLHSEKEARTLFEQEPDFLSSSFE